MHKSRLSTVVIDCRTQELDEAARFWAAALGLQVRARPDATDSPYRELEGRPEEVKILVQSVSHESRVHLDIEADDIEAEVRRLEALGYLDSKWERHQIAQKELRPPRKYYEVTRDGEAALAESLKRYKLLEGQFGMKSTKPIRERG